MKDTNHTLHKLARLNGLLHRYYHPGMHGEGHRGQGRVLAILKESPEITQGQLADKLDLRKQSLSELLAKLEHKGFITRTPSEEDKRAMTIQLTDTGKQAAGEIEKRLENKADIFAVLSPEERAVFEATLDKLTAALEKETENMPVCHGHHHHRHGHCGHHNGHHREEEQ